MKIAHKIFQKISFLNSGHERSLKAKKNIILSLFVKGTSIGITFLLVPLMIKYLNQSQYGIWVTIGSIVNWASLFDFGLGNGLRNKLAESIAKSDFKLARTYVSTTYALIALIITSVFLLYLGGQFFINWAKIFNVPDSMSGELANVMLVIVSLFSVQFVIRIIYNVLLANQSPGMVELLRMVSKLISFTTILILTRCTAGTLMNVALVFNITPTAVMLVASIFLFRKKFEKYKPSFKYINFSYSKTILNLGIQFFIMQIAVIVMFSTDNIIVTQLFGPQYVTTYDIAYKYFGVLTMFFMIIMSPFWSASTEAYTKKEFGWIKKSVRKLFLILLAISVFALFMIFIAKYVYKFWVGDTIVVPSSLNVAMAIYVILFMVSTLYVNIINGTGKIRLQFYTAIIAAIINIPLSIFLARNCNLGLAGVIIATSLSNFYGPILAPIQYYKLVNNTAKGIWNK